MKIGNIVSEDKIEIGAEFNYVDSFDMIIPNKPTLIVGYELAKTHLGSDLNFGDRVINGIYWTFTKSEQRKYHVMDLNSFIEHAYEVLVNDIKYVVVDPIHQTKKQIKKIITKILSAEKIFSYNFENKIIYISIDGIIFGIDLNLLSFIGLNVDKIKSRISSVSTVFLEGSDILIEYKNYLEKLDDQTKYVPFLYSINVDE